MHILAERLLTLPAVTQTLHDARAGHYPVALTGLSHIHKALLTLTLARASKRRILLLAADESEATRLEEDLTALGLRTLTLPAREWTLRAVTSTSHGWEHRRVGVLARILERDYDVIIACADAACAYTLPPDTLALHTLEVVAGKPMPVPNLPADGRGYSSLSAALVGMGYRRVEQIESGLDPEEAAGTFAARGGIIDIFPPGAPIPLRLELWGDEIDSLSLFDPATQRRTESIASAILPPATENVCADAAALAAKLDALASGLRSTSKTAEAIGKAKARLIHDAEQLRAGESVSLDAYLSLLYKPATLVDYIDDDALILVSEPARVRERLRTARWQMEEDIKGLLEEGQLCRGLGECLWESTQLTALLQTRAILMDTFARSTPELKLHALHHINARQQIGRAHV